MDIESAKKAIKAAFICGIISACITFIATVIAMSRGGMDVNGMKFSVLTLIDVLLIAGLTVGIYFKSRTCAVLMFVYFVWCKYTEWSAQVKLPSLMVGLAFLYFYFQGARAAFIFHRIKKAEANQALLPTTTSVTAPAGQEPRQP